MATEFTGASPLQSALAKLGQLPAQDQAKLTKSAFDGIARETNIPANVLIALDEAQGASGDATRARDNAQKIADFTKGGGSIEDAIHALAGDEASGKSILDRSYDIADALYPKAKAPEPEKQGGGILGTAADLGKTAAGAGVAGVGSMLKGAGVAGDTVLKGAISALGSRPVGADRAAPVEGETIARTAGRAAGDAVQGVGDDISQSASPEFREAMRQSTPSGELFKPSTWDLGEDPSAAGYAGIAAQGLGSMLPMVLAPNPASAAAMGGLMSGGEGADNGRQFVLDAAKTLGEDGTPEIAKLPEYKRLTGEGLTHEQATMRLAREAETNAGFRQGIFGALGGAATNKIMHSAEGWLGAGGRLARVAKKGTAGALEEGAQEALEGVGSQAGIEAATGAELNLGEDSFGNFLMGALSGGVMGAAGGAMGSTNRTRGGEEEAEGEGPLAIEGPTAPLMLPPPDRGNGGGALAELPAPNNGGTIFGEGRIDDTAIFERGQQPRPSDIAGQPAEFRPSNPAQPSAPSMGAAPSAPAPIGLDPNPLNIAAPQAEETGLQMPPMNATADGSSGGAAPAPDGGSFLSAPSGAGATITPPRGPFEAIAQTISVPQAPAPAPVRFPEHKPGSAIKLGDIKTGWMADGVFIGESPTGAIVRIDGEEVELTPRQFDAARNAVPKLEATNKAREEAAKAAPKKPETQEQPTLNLEGGNAPAPVKRGRVNVETASEPELRARLDFISSQGRRNGWNSAISKERSALETALAKRFPAPPAAAPALAAPVLAQSMDGENVEARVADDAAAPAQPDVRMGNDSDGSGAGTGEGGADNGSGAPSADAMADAGRAGGSPAERLGADTLGGMDVADDASQLGGALDTESEAAPKTGATIEHIRQKAAVVRGLPENSPPEVAGVSLKWDTKEQGFIFSRKHEDKVREALGVSGQGTTPDAAQAPENAQELTDIPKDKAKDSTAPEHRAVGVDDRELDDEAAEAALREATEELKAEGTDADTAAAEADPNPTDAQKEAGNYRKGHMRWNGLDLTIENAKGSERSGVDKSGEAWSVTMPAHYGYFKGTEGADGDHVDFYMGDVTSSDYVMIVDQVGADSGKFDEHKVILGTTSRGAALDIYRSAFSDGRGDDRIGAIHEVNVETLKNLLAMKRAWEKPLGKLDFPFKKKAKASAEVAARKAQQSPAPVAVSDRANMSPSRAELERNYELATKLGLVDAIKDAAARRLTAKQTVAELGEKLKPIEDAAKANGEAWAAQGEKETLVRSVRSKLDIPSMDDKAEFEAWIEANKPQGRPLEVTNQRTGEKNVIDPLGPLRPGYDRIRDSFGEPTTDQARMTDDGYVVRRKINQTTVTDPQGRGIFAGAFDVSEDKVNEVIAAARKPEVAANVEARAPRAKTPEAKPVETGILSTLSAEKQARAAELKARLAAKVRNQINSGLDPEYITLGAELVALYIEGGTKKFGQMLRDFAETTGLSIKEAQVPMRAAYTHVRDEMDLNGESIAGMDDHAAVMAEVRKAMAEEAAPKAEPVPARETVEDLGEGVTLTRSAALNDAEANGIAAAPAAAPVAESKPVPKEVRELVEKDAFDPSKAKGGSVKSMFKNSDRPIVKAGNWIGTNALILKTGTVPEFDTRLSELHDERPAGVSAEAIDRVLKMATNAADPVEFVIGIKGKKAAGGFVAAPMTEREKAGRKRRWVALPAQVADFAKRNGLSMTLNKDGDTFALRNAAGEVVGMTSSSPMAITDHNRFDQVVQYFRELNGEVETAAKSDTLFVSPAQESPTDDNRDHASDGGARAEEGAAAAEQGQGQAGSLRSDDRQAGAGRDRDAERAGGRSGTGGDGSRDRNGERAGRRTGGRDAGPRNHVIEAGGLELARGEKTRARESIAAIRTLRALQAEGRPATAEERATLSKYGGAGTLAGTLPRSDGTIRHPDLAAEIESLTTPEERATLSRTSQYAFYTAESALRGMWKLAQQLGFKGGRVYEPGMGVGGFAGTMPVPNATYTGLELDHLTAQIAQALYPKHTIKNGDFIKEKLPQGFYDLVIGNPPFAGTKIKADADYPQGFMIHDYFFAKSLDAVRPGGLLMFITSAGTMNKMDSAARDYLADRADLVGAIRLPNTAFKENGTEVTTDIIVLRKRLDGETEADPSWRTSETLALPREDGTMGEASVNSYFVQHPEMILGEQGLYDTLTAGDRVGVRPREGADLHRDLQDVLQKFPRAIMSEATPSVKLDALDVDHAETKAGSFYLKDGELYQFDGNTGRKVEARSRENTKGMPKAAAEAIKALIPIKSALRDVYSADVDGKDAKKARKALNDAYDGYVKARGPIGLQLRREQRPSIVEQESARQQAHNDARAAGSDFDIGSFDAGPMIEAGASMGEIARARQAAREAGNYREGDFDPATMPDKIIVSRPNIDPFMDDPESYRLLAIERYDSETDTAKKTRVFTENAVRISSTPKINSPEDALLHLLGETGRVEPAQIAALSNTSADRVIKELEGKIFQNPVTREWETKAKYLSGNVIAKLEESEREARANPEYQANVDALRAVQPAPIAANDIAVPLGSHWFPNELYSQFAKSLGLAMRAEFKPRLGVWIVDGTTTGSAATSEWGTPDRPFGDLMQLVMSNKAIEVKRSRKNSDGSTETWVDEEATQAATDKARELQERFKEWFWADEARTAEMERIYNRTFNAEVAPKYDGSYLTTPGIHSDWSWRPHQTAVIARILQSGDTYMAHTVGAGKTSAMIGAGMEAKRLGLAKKPWYVVPNHMLIQFTTEFYQQYPLAKILVADEKRFHTSKRKQFVADAALGDYDAVIITHSAFHLIPASEASKKLAVEGMLQDIRDVLEQTPESGVGGPDQGLERSMLGALNSMAATLGVDVKGITEGKTKTRKKIEALLEAAEQRISKLTSDKGKDSVFDFDETGADMLFVDEAHLFRKLSFATALGNIKGIDPQGSQGSMDLFIKTRSLNQRNPGRSLVLASGTPITNTMAELYSISRYLQPQALEDRNISAFDAWAATFGTTESALEQDPAGGYKTVTRFSKFVNTPELSLMVRQVMDVVSGKDLEQYVTRPQLKNGQRTLVVVEPSPELKDYQQELGARMKAIEARKGPVKKGDDILLSVINDGRLAAIDLRLVNPDAGDTNSKLDTMVRNIYRRWKDGKNAPLHAVKKEGGYTVEPVEHGPSTQIVFSTLGVNPTKHNPAFSVHRYIKAQLVSMGVPAEDIVLSEQLTSDARKQRAFNDMNEGKKRILIGSKTLFTGVNAQRRIAAIHNLDPLWFPADDEQRNGRGIRQGNMNPEIEILDYSAKGTYDATMWQMMARKAGFIEGFFRGDPDVRDMEDLGEASQYEQAKAMSTADPRVLQLTELRAERDKLSRRAGAAMRQRRQMEANIRSLERSIAIDREELADWQSIAERVEDTTGDKFSARAGGKTYTERKDFGADLISAAEDALGGTGFKSGDKVGTISGFAIHIDVSLARGDVIYYLPLKGDRDVIAGWSDDPVGMARKIEGALTKIKGSPARIEEAIRQRESALADTQSGLAKLKGFADQDKLDALNEQVDELEGELLAEAKSDDEKQSRLGDRAIESRDLRGLAAQVRSILGQHGLEGKISPKVIRGLLSKAGVPVLGAYQSGEVRVNADAADPSHVLRHEIIHALRDPNLWGNDYGLFTQAQWRALARAARADAGIRGAVEKAYPDLGAAGQTEEMIAEFYADWATNRAENPAGALSEALDRIRSFFRAMASALRGEGFVDAAAVMRRIADGSIGGQGPDGNGPKGGRKSDERNMVNTATKAFRDWFKDSKVVDKAGAPLVVFHGTDEEFDAFEPSARGTLGTGIYFTAEKGSADAYGGNTVSAYLALQNPWRIEVDPDSEAAYEEDLDNPATGPVLDLPNGPDLIASAKRSDAMFGMALQAQLQRMGHDGIIATYPDGSTEYVAFKSSQIKSVDNRGSFDPADDRIKYQRGEAPEAAGKFATEFMTELAAHDELFAYPRSKAGSLKGTLADIAPEMKYVGDATRPEESDESGADRRHLLRTPLGKDVYVYETDESVWLDVSWLGEGERGSAIYMAVGDYARNAALTFIGDPAGLSDIALRRRTDAMLSSAIRHGSTNHLRPHPRQIEGDSALGVPPLKWTEGDYFANVANMIAVSTASLSHYVPEISNARYDFASRTFRTGKGEPLSDGMLASWYAHPRIRAARAGRNSLKRAIMLNSLLRAESGARPRLLEQALRWQSEHVRSGGLSGILYQHDLSGLKRSLSKSKGRALGMIGNLHWKKAPSFFSNLLTDAMGKNDRFNILSLVPGHPLFSELGKRIPAAQAYLGFKQNMDADRNKYQARTSAMVDKWTETARKDPEANDILMDLMHRTTLAGIDPSKADGWKRDHDDAADRVGPTASQDRKDWAARVKADQAIRQKTYASLKAEFVKLPPEFRKLYAEVRDEYSKMADEMDAALMENIRTASRIARKRADRTHRKELQRIKDEGLSGQERADAIGKANEELARAHARAARGSGAHLKKLRQEFESNRLQGPYFPLARFGNYFVTIRDASGKVISFSKFEKASQQEAWIKQAEADKLGKVEHGVITNAGDMKAQIDPTFLADVEGILDEEGASREMMDAVWQRYLESLPDQSLRTSRIHRKGRAGFNRDAVRAFSSAMFHGAHQTARLRYGMEMEEALNDAEEQAKVRPDSERAGFVVREMRQRHAFTMSPTNNPMVTAATSLVFVWYLGMSPAAALVNVTQTSVVGIPLMAARFKKAGVTGAIRELTRASKEFAKGKGHIEKASTLSAEEKAAMDEAYRRGVIDKTQAHDLAAVAESGVEYSPTREKVMRVIGWGFHHAERFNREVTFLANYRMLRAEGMSHNSAISEADSLVKKIHFDYQNTSKPRAMQGDAVKIFTVFRNFTVNMLYRLFRDTHQAFKGADDETRREARAQLIGITLSMMSHAGIRGVWGYGLLMGLLGLFFPGGGDDMDEWLQDALLIEGDNPAVASWNWIMGLALNGAPGHALGIDLTSRIGMPDLWFRSTDRDLEGSDLWAYYMEQLAGPVFGIGGNMVMGMSQLMDGQYLRGTEKMIPTFARNVVKTGRYLNEGVTTYNGDELVDGLNPWQYLMQVQGFTPAEVSERYKINSRLKNDEKRITDRRKAIMKEIGDAVRKGDPISESSIEKMRKFNAEIPEWAITAKSIRQSVASRERASQRNELGVAINDKINARVRDARAPALYD